VKLTERDLVGIIVAHRRESLGAEDGDLSNQRAKAMDHYHGRPYGNEVDGRSQVVSRDLAETVDWAMPAIMRAFVQSGNLGEFTPVGPEDEQLAQQESDYVNQVLMKDNPGFLNLHDVVKDTLLLKNGYAKHFWEVKDKVEDVEYTGLTLDALTKMVRDIEGNGGSVEVKGQDSRFVAIPGMPQQQNEAQAIMQPAQIEVFDVRLQIKRKTGKLIWMAVPSEEVRVSKRCRGSLQESPFTEHVTRKTRSELIEMGIPRSFVDELPAHDSDDNSQERNARDSVTDETNDEFGTSYDRSMDEIDFCEAYIRVDWDGDGIAELRKVVTCADRIPPGEEWNEPIPAVPMTGFVMKRVPHRHVGESLDDELSDLQEIKTTLHRQLLDNVYLTNNSQVVVNERVNLRDMLTSTPGGVKRVKGADPVAGSVMPLVTAPIIDKILPVIDYWDKSKEVRSGIRPGSDMDPDVLKETTKGAFLEHLNRASQKIEMITRLIAETGVKELVLQAHGILVRHQDQARMVQLRGKWVQVNPQEWQERTDLTVRVGLGTGNEEEKRQKLLLLTGLQEKLLMAATMAPPEVYAKAYAMFEDVAAAMSIELPEKYAVAPGSPEYQKMAQEQANKPNPEVQKVQAEIQAKSQIEQMRMQMQMETDRNRQAMEAQQQAARMQMEMQLEQAKAQMQMELERERMRIKAETDVLIARINAQSKVDSAQLQAQATLTPEQEAASDGAVDAQ
jgi:hypothetical protein